jgi:hypothetical protein
MNQLSRGSLVRAKDFGAQVFEVVEVLETGQVRITHQNMHLIVNESAVESVEAGPEELPPSEGQSGIDRQLVEYCAIVQFLIQFVAPNEAAAILMTL